jgi:hypothetical protein
LVSSKKFSARSFALAGGLSFLIIQLNIYFAWTSHVGATAARGFFYGGSHTHLRTFLVSEVNDFAKIQLGIPALSSLFTNLASRSAYNVGFFGDGKFHFVVSPNSLAVRYLIDTEVILFTFAVFVISLFLFQKSGIGIALLRAFEITSLTILPLGLEIFFLDRSEFNIHASAIQRLAGMAWFTNADVLFLSSAILGMALSVEVMRYASKGDSGKAKKFDKPSTALGKSAQRRGVGPEGPGRPPAPTAKLVQLSRSQSGSQVLKSPIQTGRASWSATR